MVNSGDTEIQASPYRRGETAGVRSEVVVLEGKIKPEWFEESPEDNSILADELNKILIKIKRKRSGDGNPLTLVQSYDPEGNSGNASSDDYLLVIRNMVENGSLLIAPAFPGINEKWRPRIWKKKNDEFKEMKLKRDLRFETPREWQSE